MSNITQFFPGGSSGGGGIEGGGFNRRDVYVGPLSTTWTAGSPGNVEVTCWGGGGAGAPGPGGGGGGGGGYVRYIYSVVTGDQLSISVGATAGTSSVSCPTQSPTSPISATGGSNALAPELVTPSFDVAIHGGGNPQAGIGTGGAGGVGSGTVPSPRSGYLLTRSGGRGANGSGNSPLGPGQNTYYGGGGGAAGNEYSNGTNAFPPLGNPSPGVNPQGFAVNGAGIGGVGIGSVGGPGNWLSNLGAPPTLPFTPWFYSYELIGGAGGDKGNSGPGTPTTNPPGTASGRDGGFLAGGGGGERVSGGSQLNNNTGGRGGIAGGGGGGGLQNFPIGIAGTGGVGIVIVYYSV